MFVSGAFSEGDSKMITEHGLGVADGVRGVARPEPGEVVAPAAKTYPPALQLPSLTESGVHSLAGTGLLPSAQVTS